MISAAPRNGLDVVDLHEGMDIATGGTNSSRSYFTHCRGRYLAPSPAHQGSRLSAGSDGVWVSKPPFSPKFLSLFWVFLSPLLSALDGRRFEFGAALPLGILPSVIIRVLRSAGSPLGVRDRKVILRVGEFFVAMCFGPLFHAFLVALRIGKRPLAGTLSGLEHMRMIAWKGAVTFRRLLGIAFDTGVINGASQGNVATYARSASEVSRQALGLGVFAADGFHRRTLHAISL